MTHHWIENYLERYFLLGCYKDAAHHSWILGRGKYKRTDMYNVRLGTRAGSVASTATLTRSPRFLVLYDVSDATKYSVYRIKSGGKCDKEKMLKLGYATVHAYVEATAKTLQALNLRLLGFGVETFDVVEAKAIVSELGVFLDRFGRRFGPLREEIAADLAELSKPTQERRWAACVERLKTESARFRRIASVRIPDPQERLADARSFYAPDGRLVALMSRVGDSARRVWGKLNAKLRELERCNHRLEDLGARLADLSVWPEEGVPYDWLRGLLATAAMRGDAQIRPDGERSRHPLPKLSERTKRARIVTWITPRKVGAKADVASIEQARGERLKDWMRKAGVFPESGKSVRLGCGRYATFADCRGIVDVIVATRLGGGRKARRHLGVAGAPCLETSRVSLAEGELVFQDLKLIADNATCQHEIIIL